MTVPWSRPSTSRRKEILGPESTSGIIRPIRTEARSRLIAAIARGRRWLEQLIDGDVADIAAIAGRENLSDKTIRSMLSLAFLAPDIVQAAIDGRLPRGFGVSQLTDLPLMWQSQRRQLGLVK